MMMKKIKYYISENKYYQSRMIFILFCSSDIVKLFVIEKMQMDYLFQYLLNNWDDIW